MRNRRIVVPSSVGLSALLAVTALILVRPAWFWSNTVPGPVMSGQAVLGGPVVGLGGHTLTRLATRTALLVEPSTVPAAERAALGHAIGSPVPSHGSYLWMAPASVRRLWTRRVPALQRVRVQRWIPQPGVPIGVLSAAAAASHAVTRGPWSLEHGIYQIAATSPTVRLDLDGQLSHALSQAVGDRGAVVVLSRRGEWIGAAGSQKGAIWQGRPVGMAGLPPLLAWALADKRVASKVNKEALSLSQMAALWGTGGLIGALHTLGYATGRIGFSPDPNPALPTLSSAVFSSGTGLRATPLELAQSFLPFVGSPARVAMQGAPARARRLSGQVSKTLREVLDQMPSVTLNGISYRIWRPAGDYAVIIAPELREVAVLEGAAVERTMSVVQILGEKL